MPEGSNGNITSVTAYLYCNFSVTWWIQRIHLCLCNQKIPHISEWIYACHIFI